MKRPGRLLLRVPVLAALASAWLPLPVPVSWLPDEVAIGDGARLHLTVAGATVRWADGRIHVEGAAARLGSVTRLDIAEAVLRVSPWRALTGAFPLEAVRASGVVGATGPADVDLLQHLLRSEGRPPPLPPVALSLVDGRLVWEDPRHGLELPLRVHEIAGRLGPEASRLHGRLRDFTGHDIQAWARCDEDPESWTLDLACLAEPLASEPELPAPLAAAGAERCSIRGHLETVAGGLSELLLDVRLTGGQVALARPDLALRDLDLEVHGTLESGLEASLAATVEGLPVALRGWVVGLRDGAPRVLASGELGPVAVDEGLTARLREIDPGAAEPLEALAPRGVTTARLGFAWDAGEAARWAVYAPLAGFRMSYHGFREPDGSRPSFPYPVQDLAGASLFAGRTLVFTSTGAAGAGRLTGQAVVELQDGPAAVSADLRMEDLPVDAEITRAVAGTPDLRAVWSELGHPGGGALDAAVTIRRPPGVLDPRVEVQVRGTAREVSLRPRFLPVAVVAERVGFQWRPGAASFHGTMRALGGRAELEGAIHAARSGGLPAAAPTLRVSGRGRGFAPDEADRRALEAFLDLPPGSADFRIAGPVDVEVGLRRAAREGPPQVLVRFDGGGAEAEWTVTGLRCRELRGRGAMARDGLASLVSLPRASATVNGGRADLSLAGVLQEGRGVLPITARADAIQLDPVLQDSATQVLGFELPERLSLGGRAGGHLRLDPARSDGLRGLVRLQELECAATYRDREARMRLAGQVEIRGSQLHAARLEIEHEGRLTELHRLLVEPLAGGGLRATTEVVSRDGLEVEPAAAALLAPEAAEALDRIGLGARLGADGLHVEVELPATGEPRLEASGGMWLDGVRLEGPPRLRGGSARLAVRELRWNGPQDFLARVSFRAGGGKVEGMALGAATGEAILDPSGIEIRPFTASLLGGKVSSRPSDPEDTRTGRARLRFAPGPPLYFQIFLEGLSLERMREELDLAAGMAGRVSGYVEMASASPSPLDYSGQGELTIQDGALGAVPVLKDVWRAAGVRPPQFHSGFIRFATSPEPARGTVRIDEFRLEHELLEAFGKGWIDMDGYLRLKVTVRTFSVLGRLPLVKDLLDALLEQDVFGPLEQPTITHRAVEKITGREKPRYPFPLWAPDPDRPDWRISPILPQARNPAAKRP